MNYTELEVSVKPVIPGREILISGLADIGFESFSETGKGFLAYIPSVNFDDDKINSVFSEYSEEFSIQKSVKEIPAENWNKNWESNFDPIEIGNALLIRAPFHSTSGNHRFEVVIQPQMSFGTGHHETTWLMSKRLLEKDVNNKTVLDIGCGTAILAILAEKKGASSVYATDIDEWAFVNALENVKINNCHRIIVEKGGAELLNGKKFQFILANINLNVLLADMNDYINALENEGTVLFSGLFVTDADQLKLKAENSGLTFVGKEEKNNWVMVEFQKK